MIDPGLERYLAFWNDAWKDFPADGSEQERRRKLEEVSARMAEPLPAGMRTAEVPVPAGAGRVRAKAYVPAGVTQAPVLIYMHGGAFMQGSPETCELFVAPLAAQAGCVVLSVDYSLSPEHRFPVALRECEAVVRWAAAQKTIAGVTRGALLAGGDSAGGNLAAALSLMLRGDVPLAGQLLFYPTLAADQDARSYVEHANAPILTTARVKEMWRLYHASPATLRDPLSTPLSAADVAKLPPAFITVAQNDPLRDDGLAYAARLEAAGVPVTLDRGESLIHGYLRAWRYSKPVEAVLARAAEWIRQFQK